MDHRPSVDLLESNHPFPGVYQIKAIGLAEGDFEGRVVAAVVSELGSASSLDYSVRATPGGRHIAITLQIQAQSADQVRSIYARIHALSGLSLVL